MTDTQRPDLGGSVARGGTGRRSAGASTSSSASAEPGRGFHPNSRRRNRIAIGVLLVAVAIGGNALVYASLDDSEPVLQVVQDVPAGVQITSEMVRAVDVDADPTVNLVSSDDLASVVGQYAKVRLVSGSLITQQALQADPLVSPDSAVVAVQVAEGSLPLGLRERVPVVLVVPPGTDGGDPVTIDGMVVGLPQETTSALGQQSLSVEIARADAPPLAAADDVRVVLVEPALGPVDPGAGDADDEDGGDPSEGSGG